MKQNLHVYSFINYGHYNPPVTMEANGVSCKYVTTQIGCVGDIVYTKLKISLHQKFPSMDIQNKLPFMPHLPLVQQVSVPAFQS